MSSALPFFGFCGRLLFASFIAWAFSAKARVNVPGAPVAPIRTCGSPEHGGRVPPK